MYIYAFVAYNISNGRSIFLDFIYDFYVFCLSILAYIKAGDVLLPFLLYNRIFKAVSILLP